MKFEVTIFGVDGKTTHQITASSVQEIKLFLEAYDHEGSMVTMMVDAKGEDAYILLDRLSVQPLVKS